MAVKKRGAEYAPLVLETMEPRLLFAADGILVSAIEAVADVGSVYPDTPKKPFFPPSTATEYPDTSRADAGSGSVDPGAIDALDPADLTHPIELVFVDSSLSDIDALLTALATDDTHHRIVLLEPDQSGLETMTNEVIALEQVSGIHVLTHGYEGGISLGSDTLSANLTGEQTALLQQWRAHLTADSDLLFYACDVAGYDSGMALLAKVEELTSADVFASNNRTGNSIGSDWALEYRSGSLDVQALGGYSAIQQWSIELASITVTITADTVDGDVSSINALLANQGEDNGISLREAILAANVTAGEDEIILDEQTFLLGIDGVDDNASAGDLDVTDALTITGAGAADTVIDAQGHFRHFEILDNAAFAISGVSLVNGASADNGGSIAILGGTTTLDSVSFTGNNSSAGSGGAVAVSNATLNANALVFSDNSSRLYGGALSITAGAQALISEGTQFLNNEAREGGAVFNGGALEVLNPVFTGNTANLRGGDLYNDGVTLISGAVSTLGTAAFAGGSIYSTGTLTLDGVYIDNARSSTGSGGGVSSHGTTSIVDSTIANAEAARGGGVRIDGGITHLTNTTLSANTALDANGGGMLVQSGTAVLDHVTLDGNTALTLGGAIANQSGNVSFSNSVFAANTAATDPQINGTFTSTGFNMDSGNTLGLSTLGDLSNAAVNLAPLAAINGSIPVHALLSGSEAIDAAGGNRATDATGVDRNEFPDMGAFEYRYTDAPDKIYWASDAGQSIWRGNSDGGAVQKIVDTLQTPFDLEVDVGRQRIYWTESDGDSGEVWSASLDGSGVLPILDTSSSTHLVNPMGLAVDSANGVLYVMSVATDGNLQTANKLLSFDVDTATGIGLPLYQATSENPTLSIATPAELEFATTFPAAEAGLGWIDEGGGSTPEQIAVMDIDATGAAAFEWSGTSGYPTGLALNSLANQFYLTDLNDVSRYSVDVATQSFQLDYELTNATGSSAIEINSDASGVVFALYGTGANDGSIYSADAELGNASNMFSNLQTPRMLAIASPAAVSVAPVVIYREALSGEEGGTVTLTNAELLVTDVDNPDAEIVFEITTAPDRGHIALATSSNVPVSAFTQDDIANGRVVYVHDDSEVVNDAFIFSVSDGVNTEQNLVVEISLDHVIDNVPQLPDAMLSVDEGGSVDEFDDGSPSLLTNLTDIDTDDTASLSLVSNVSAGTLSINPDGSFVYQHNDSEVATDQFVYRVTDSGSLSTDVTVDIAVTLLNDNAPSVPDASLSVLEGMERTVLEDGSVSLLQNWSDVDTGDSATIGLWQDAQYGSVSIGTDNTFVYQHDGSENFNDSFIYRVTDSGSNHTDVTVMVTVGPVNDNDPVVPDASITVVEGGMANSNDAGDTDLLAQWSDVDVGDTATVSLLSDVSHGTLTLVSGASGDNTFLYQHDDSETATDEFVYRVTDAAGNYTDVTVDIDIELLNDNAPIAPNRSLTLDEGASTSSFDDGETSVVSLVTDVDSGDSVTASIISNASHGVFTLNPDNSFSYDHDGGESTSDSVVMRLTDSGGLFTDVIIDINIIPQNDNAPVVPNGLIRLQEGAASTQLVSGDTDLLAQWSDVDVGDTATVSLLSDVSHGTLTLVSGASGDNTFLYQHDDSETATDEFVYRVTDAAGNYTDVTVDIDIELLNDNAPIAPNRSLTLDEGASTSSFDDGENSVLSFVSDADIGDTHTASVLVPAAHGVFTINADHGFSYQHNDTETTADSVLLRVTDSGGLFVDTRVDIKVAPVNDHAPVVPDGILRLNEGASVDTMVSGDTSLLSRWSDIDIGDSASVMLLRDVDYGVLTVLPDYSFSYQHDDSETLSDGFVYRVTDMAGQFVDVSVSIEVLPINDNAPQLETVFLRVDEGDTTTVSADGHDSLLFRWSDVDVGDNAVTRLLTDGLVGNAVVNLDGSFSYQHDGSESRVDKFLFRVTDAGGNSTDVVANVAIAPVNDQYPVLADGFISLMEGGVATTLSSSAGSLLSLWSDVDVGDTAHFTLLEPARYGEFVVAGDGRFSYRHDGSETAADQVTIRVEDLAGQQAEARVWIEVLPVNDSAPALDTTILYVREGGSVSALADGSTSLLARWHDADVGDTVAFSLLQDARHGSINVSTNGDFTYQHDDSESIDDWFLVQLEDALGHTTDARIDITIESVNDNSPVLPDQQLLVSEGAAVSALVNGSTNLLALAVDDDRDDTVTLVGASSPGQGSLRWSGDGSFEYLHDGSETPADSFTITIEDSAGHQVDALVSIAIEPVNDPPLGVALSASEVRENEPGAYIGRIEVDDADADDEHLISTSDPRLVVIGDALQLQADAAMDYETEPVLEAMLTVVDRSGSTLTAPIQLAVLDSNDAPIVSQSMASGVVSPMAVLAVPDTLFVDADQDSLRFGAALASGEALPAWLEFDATGGYFTILAGAPADSRLDITLTATDPDGAKAETTFWILTEPMLVPALPLEAEKAGPEPPWWGGVDISTSQPSASGNAASESLMPESAATAAAEQTDDASVSTDDQADTKESDQQVAMAVHRFSGDDSAVSAHIVRHQPQIQVTVSPLAVVKSSTAVDRDASDPRGIEGSAADSRETLRTMMKLETMPLLELLERVSFVPDAASVSLTSMMNQQRTENESVLASQRVVVSSTIAATSSVSVGYFVWLLRGGVLLGSMMSSLPAWRLVDPFTVLGTLDAAAAEGDSETLQSLVEQDVSDRREAAVNANAYGADSTGSDTEVQDRC